MRAILASHLVFTGYGHWLANDPRGSGSESLRKDELGVLGSIHFGRKRWQPSRHELRAFYKRANELLDHRPLWFNFLRRTAIAQAVEKTCAQRGYTCWAFAICRNHAHGVFRSHRDHAEIIWQSVADGARDALRAARRVLPAHPVWAKRPYKVFLYSQQDVEGRIGYVNDNPIKEGLARQEWGFVKSCPYVKR